MANKFALDNTSPYYVHPSEGSRTLISVVIFNGENYDLWVKAVTTTLGSKNKLEFVDGKLKDPTIIEGKDRAEIDALETVNSTICS